MEPPSCLGVVNQMRELQATTIANALKLISRFPVMIGNDSKYTNINHNRASLNTIKFPHLRLYVGFMWSLFFIGHLQLSGIWQACFKNGRQKDTWYNAIGLNAQNIDTTLGLIVHNNIGLSDYLNLTYFNF